MAEETHTRQLVVFALGGERYGLPIKQVHEIIRYTQPRSVASADMWSRGVLNLRGRLVPVYDLAARLGVSAEIGEQSKIVILESGSVIAGVIVDAVDEVLTIGQDRIEKVPSADNALIESIAKIGERLVVLLTPSAIFGEPELDLAA
jgi:purine-binding chemotaxis protein CheW